MTSNNNNNNNDVDKPLIDWNKEFEILDDLRNSLRDPYCNLKPSEIIQKYKEYKLKLDELLQLDTLSLNTLNRIRLIEIELVMMSRRLRTLISEGWEYDRHI